MTFVQAPVPDDRNPHQVHLVLYVPKCANGAFEYRGVRDIKFVAELMQQTAGGDRFLIAFFSKVDIHPTGEQVFQVPVTLPVTTQNKLASHCYSRLS